jgi:hypothetical protein
LYTTPRAWRGAHLVSALILSLSFSHAAQAQEAPRQPQTPTPQPQQPTPQQPGQGRPGGFQLPPGARVQAPPSTKPRPYAEVVTREAKTDDGLIKVHQIDERYLWEIPANLLGKELLWVTSLRQTQTGYGYGGQEVSERVVRFEKRGDKILMRGVSYQTRPVTGGGMEKSLELSSLEPILQVFDVRAYNDDNAFASVIDVTGFLNSDPAEFSPRRRLSAARIDPTRSFIDKVKSLPQNVEIDILATYQAAPAQPIGIPGMPQRAPRQDGPQPDRSTDAITAVVHHSVVLLPEKPMKPRIFDSRVGYFATGFYEFGSPENRVKELAYIKRWRLEKKDPSAAVSEPVKPITYYLGPEIPDKWRSYIKQGIEDWKPVFEKAGFKNAIVAKDAPKDDPDFDPDDVRYSVIRWFPSATENAYGPSIADPRTGEILNANARFFYNVLKLAQTWYFTQASPNDKRAQKLPLPDDLTGQLLRYVVSHEIGHTLGLRHNGLASSTVTIKQLRDPKFTAQWGNEASIMDYGRFNYVAQPEDKVTRLIPKVGPYDYFAIEWGYKELPGATADADKSSLNLIAAQQSKNPMLRWGSGWESPITLDDPSQQAEDLGDDAVEATRLGLKNIDRVMSYLVSATTKPGEDYELLDETYNDVLGQRSRELSHVARIIGGYNQKSIHFGQPGATDPANFKPVPAAKQRQAMQFLVANALRTPTSLIRQDILSRIEPTGTYDRILQSQAVVVASLLSETRAKRMVDMEARYGTANVYPLSEMVEDLRKGVWTELAAPKVAIDPYRRNLQRAYITTVAARMTESTSELRPLLRGALVDTKAGITGAIARATDRSTKLHLQDCLQIIERTLNPK